MSIKFSTHVTAIFIVTLSVPAFPQAVSRFSTENFRLSTHIEDRRACSKRSAPDGFVSWPGGIDVCFRGLKLTCYKQGSRSDPDSPPISLLPSHAAIEDCHLHPSYLSKLWVSSDTADFSRAKLELQNSCEGFKLPADFNLEEWKQISELAVARLKYKLTNPLCFARAAAELDIQLSTNSPKISASELVEAKKYLEVLNNACLKVSDNKAGL